MSQASDTLNAKQLRFCQEYVIDHNALQAAVRAGYKERGARTTGYRMLKHKGIIEEVRRLDAEAAIKAGVDAARVMEELSKLAFANMADFVGDDGQARDISELTRSQAACIAEINDTVSDTGERRKFKLYDKLRALEMLGRTLAMFKDTNIIDDKRDAAKALAEALNEIKREGPPPLMVALAQRDAG